MQFKIVRAELMGRLEITFGITDSPVAAEPFSFLEDVERAMETNEEYIDAVTPTKNALHPFLSLDNVLDDDVISGYGEGGNGSLKSLKEALT